MAEGQQSLMTRSEIATGALYRLLVDGVREYAIFALDPEGFLLTWVRGAEQLKGYSCR